MQLDNRASMAMAQPRSVTDLQGLSDIKALNRDDKDAAAEAVAEQFESVFVNMLMKQMRASNQVFREGNFLNGPETKMYRQMYDQQLAMELSKDGGLGLTDVIKRQLLESGASVGSGDDSAGAPEGAAADAAGNGPAADNKHGGAS